MLKKITLLEAEILTKYGKRNGFADPTPYTCLAGAARGATVIIEKKDGQTKSLSVPCHVMFLTCCGRVFITMCQLTASSVVSAFLKCERTVHTSWCSTNTIDGIELVQYEVVLLQSA